MIDKKFEIEKIKILKTMYTELKNVWKTRRNRIGTTTFVVQMRSKKDAFSKLLNIQEKQLKTNRKINENIKRLLRKVKGD